MKKPKDRKNRIQTNEVDSQIELLLAKQQEALLELQKRADDSKLKETRERLGI